MDKCIYAGAPFLYLMKNMDLPYDKMKAGFITHMHSDHALQAYSYLMTCPGSLYLPEESDIKSMESLVHFMHEEWAYTHCGRCQLKSVHNGLVIYRAYFWGYMPQPIKESDTSKVSLSLLNPI